MQPLATRLSKGRNTKAHWSDFILCAYNADPDVEIENVQQVRAVFEHGEWRLHIVSRHEIEVESPGNRTAGVDLGICNIAAVSFGDESLLYPGGALKEDEYYFAKKRTKESYECRSVSTSFLGTLPWRGEVDSSPCEQVGFRWG